jgi:branched-chain amino acid transport system permease protein
MSYYVHLIVMFEIYLVIALSLNLLLGYSGLLQLAQAAYFGVGAYTSALISLKFGTAFFPAIIAGGAAAALASLLVSVPAWRFRGDYFVMVSLAVQTALYSLMHNLTSVTNGPYGVSNIPNPAISGIRFDTAGSISALYGIIVAITFTLTGLLKSSPFGRSLQAIRDDELAARSLGLPVNRLKLQVFMVASALVGMAGAMYGAYTGYIDPSSFSLEESVLMLSMVIIGGTGNLRGPLIGAIIMVALPEGLRFLHFPDLIAGSVRVLAYGLLLMAMMLWRPQGLLGKYKFD